MELSAISPQIVHDFASKVATPGSRAMFLDEHNLKVGFASIANAFERVRLHRRGA